MARPEIAGLAESEVRRVLERVDPLWGVQLANKQARIVRLLVERVTMTTDGLAVDLRTDGLGTVVREILAPKPEEAIA